MKNEKYNHGQAINWRCDMLIHIECPSCHALLDLLSADHAQVRTFCRHCGARLEVRVEPLMEVVRLPLQAEDFGI
jgi:hypothetical protein